MVEIHDVMGVPLATVRTGNRFRLSNQVTISLDALPGEFLVVFLMPFVVFPLIDAVALAAPVLWFPVPPNSECRQWQVLAASRARCHGLSSCLGAGEGNRTLVLGLEDRCSTIELHPHYFYPPWASGQGGI